MSRRLVAVTGVLAVLLAAGLVARRLFPRTPELDACRGALSQPAMPGPSLPPEAPGAVPDGAQPAVTVAVVDGDGICVRALAQGPLAAGMVHEVRLVGINAPGAGRCGSEQAVALVRERIGEGRVVYLLGDVEDRDRYQRALRYVWAEDGGFFNVDSVREGAARALVKAPNQRYASEIRGAEKEARDAGAGVWHCLPWKLVAWLR